MTRFDSDDIREELRRGDIVAHYGWKMSAAGRWLRARECPSCGGGASEAFSIGAEGYICHRCNARGDLIGLVALAEGLNVRRDFGLILERAAEIAGVEPEAVGLSAEERERRLWSRARERREAERKRSAEERARLERAARKASGIWEGLGRFHREGESYMRARGLGGLVGREDLIRFDRLGTLRVPLYDKRGRIVNVPGRSLPGREPRPGQKIVNVFGCPTLGTFGRLGDVPKRSGDVLILEGIADYLSALVLWPHRASLGAHGAARLPHVAEWAAAQILDTDRALRFVPHADAAGMDARKKAARAAMDIGLPRSRVRALDISGRGGDLNDWLCAEEEG